MISRTFIYIFILLTFNGFSQSLIKGEIIDSRTNTPLKKAKIELFRQSDTVNHSIKVNNSGYLKTSEIYSNKKGKFRFKNLKRGIYEISYSKTVDSIGYREEHEHIGYLSDTTISIKLPFICVLNYEVKFCPKCLKNDHSIPIIYGYPSDEDLKKQAKGEVFIAGCIFDRYCGPTKYCKLDDIQY